MKDKVVTDGVTNPDFAVGRNVELHEHAEFSAFVESCAAFVNSNARALIAVDAGYQERGRLGNHALCESAVAHVHIAASYTGVVLVPYKPICHDLPRLTDV